MRYYRNPGAVEKRHFPIRRMLVRTKSFFWNGSTASVTVWYLPRCCDHNYFMVNSQNGVLLSDIETFVRGQASEFLLIPIQIGWIHPNFHPYQPASLDVPQGPDRRCGAGWDFRDRLTGIEPSVLWRCELQLGWDWLAGEQSACISLYIVYVSNSWDSSAD